MKASVQRISMDDQSCTILTENNLAIVFGLPYKDALKIGDNLEVELKHSKEESIIKNKTSGKVIRVRIAENDIHNLNLRNQHGSSRSVF